ncbi:MAG TPA: hypothetical protein VFN26_06255 [Candidatus Acidoferrum sp.]|nr:hypothetical protein [Candidatus Acidoferrum sp.]
MKQNRKDGHPKPLFGIKARPPARTYCIFVGRTQQRMRVASPKNSLLEGAEILERVLLPNDFHFQFQAEGKSSGGNYAWGEFIRGDRKLEVHVRGNLGLVRYHIGTDSVSHESYMLELGVREQCQYPGFSDDPKKAFLGLAHDLAFVDDFLTGTGARLRQAAIKESADSAARNADLMAGYVGDKTKIDELRSYFRQQRYEDVIIKFRSLKYPERLSESERKMVELARQRSLNSRR